MKKKVLLFFILACTCLALASFAFSAHRGKLPVMALLNPKQAYIAGEPVVLSFKAEGEFNGLLILKSSYGSVVVSPTTKAQTLDFSIPVFFARKAGMVSWWLVQDKTEISKGSFEIQANQKVALENYLGPRSMLVGYKNYTMMVAVPTDNFDNPKPDGTPTTIKAQFLESITQEVIPVKDFISWKRLHAPEKSGKLLTSISCFGVETKETETDVFPSLPTDFTVSYSRNHRFADGNQLTTLTTSIIKDEFNNVVSDGTLVDFVVATKENMLLKTCGTTINGVAEAKILSPEHAETYQVTAFVTGMAKSSSISIDYEQVYTKIACAFSADKRTVTVGPLRSFMGQITPEGTTVTLEVYRNNKKAGELVEFTNSKGIAVFTIRQKRFPEKEYTFIITALGNKSQPATIKYD
jgi:hypothetical protein